MTETLAVKFFTLTDARASEHIYMGALRRALTERGIRPVENWREADVVHLFEVNVWTRDAVRAFRVPTLGRMLRSATPVVVSTDDLYFIDEPGFTAHPRLYPLNHVSQRWLFRRTDAVIAISESVKRALSRELSPAKIHVVRHGVDPRYFADGIEEEPFVFHASLASKRKNPRAVLDVAERLDARFVIAGSGWSDLVPDRLRERNVEVTGYVPEHELVDFYHRAAIFYFPTLHEGFGLPVLEAMAAHNAVVTSDVYAVPEVAGDAAVLCDPHDTDAHAAAIGELLENPEKRRRLADGARTRAERFSWEVAAERTEAVYRSVLDESVGHRGP